MFNMGYEHHEQPPIYFGSARGQNAVPESMSVAPSAARYMQLWGWPHSKAQQRRSARKESGPAAKQGAGSKDDMKSKLQKLWMFNMGYEHHEQPPIYFGSARGQNAVPESMSVAPTAAREMQLWGWPQAQAMSAREQQGTAPAAKQGVGSKGDMKSKLQKLWMFNMGYEHHEQPPIYFGSARKVMDPVM
jgi:thiamine phosphate synthase YjbQ (UPF0047 family)